MLLYCRKEQSPVLSVLSPKAGLLTQYTSKETIRQNGCGSTLRYIDDLEMTLKSVQGLQLFGWPVVSAFDKIIRVSASMISSEREMTLGKNHVFLTLIAWSLESL